MRHGRPVGRGGRFAATLLASVLAYGAASHAVEAAPPRVEDGARSEAVWVFFEDRPLDAVSRSVELERREAELDPRALARRARQGAWVADRDLAVHEPWVDALVALGARVRTRSRWLNAVSVDATPQQRRALDALAFVRGTRAVAAFHRDPVRAARTQGSPRGTAGLPETNQAQIDIVGAGYLQACGYDGTGVVVGILDTGFALEHPALASVDVLAVRDFINGDEDVGNEDEQDDPGQHFHGTAILSVVAGADGENYIGAAPGVSVLLAKTEDISMEEMVEEDWYVEGLEWIEAMGADLATASLGYIDWYTYEDLDGATAVTTLAVNAATENGLMMFSAMGNGGPEGETLIAPADGHDMLSIGAVWDHGLIAEFSSRGPTADGRQKPELVAPGVKVIAADANGDEPYRPVSGTSLATPLAAGATALLMQAYPDSSAAELRQLLMDSAHLDGTPDDTYGFGRIDVRAAVGDLCACDDVDQDGELDEMCGGNDCDDYDPAVIPGAEEICNGHDDDCDGELFPDEEDVDNDGVPVCGGDCDDEDPFSSPELEEDCDDGRDNDCDGAIDLDDDECEEETTGGEDGGDPTAGDGDGDSGTGDAAGDAAAEGCSCRTGAAKTGPGWLGLLALLAFVRRRSAA